MNIPDGVRNTFVLMESFYCTKAATTKEIQYHAQITAWQKKPGDRGFCAQQKTNQTPMTDFQQFKFLFSFIWSQINFFFNTKLRIFICPSQKLQQCRKYIGSGSTKTANQPLGRLAAFGKTPKICHF